MSGSKNCLSDSILKDRINGLSCKVVEACNFRSHWRQWIGRARRLHKPGELLFPSAWTVEERERAYGTDGELRNRRKSLCYLRVIFHLFIHFHLFRTLSFPMPPRIQLRWPRWPHSNEIFLMDKAGTCLHSNVTGRVDAKRGDS